MGHRGIWGDHWRDPAAVSASRFAFHAFCAGLFGSVVMGAFVISFPMPRTAGDMAMEFSEQIQPVFWVIEWLIFAAIIFYTHRLSASEVLE